MKQPISKWLRPFLLAIIGLGLALGAGYAGARLYLHAVLESQTTLADSTMTPTSQPVSAVTTDDSAAAAYRVISPAVVTVVNYTAGSQALYPYQQPSGQSSGAGSGVIYKRDDKTYFIVTNEHVITDATAIEVVLNDGTTHTATLVGDDPLTDLAVLKITSDSALTTAQFAASNAAATGQSVLAVGSPLGLAFAASATKGVISATERQMTLPVGNTGKEIQTTVLQTDAAINSGNSGGPLVDMAGQIVGINSMKLSGTSGGGATIEDMSFAIPSATVAEIVAQLEKDGEIERPTLAATAIDLSRIARSQQRSVLALPASVTEGVVVVAVGSGTNLQTQDVIVSLNGEPVTSAGNFYQTLYAQKPGATVKLTIYRAGKQVTINETLGTSAEAMR
ncbi:S1C family serine protease [Lacticaseibacillus mingshuiensis]|uniref:S1C family serine protease n=1 Tax=Lacticaseibacillus mingshuiensis TaxID=2799574 RepID=A0ABW4CGU1_9LACO|nr:trypsin-like peptidase domain-containing protein [Lacticaseibacillus mingshuiensis]